MTTKDFEIKLKEIDENLNIRPAAVADMEGVYYKDIFIIGIPSNNIYEETDPNYKNELGTPHKIIPVALAQIAQWLANIEEELEIDREFRELTQKKEPQQILK